MIHRLASSTDLEAVYELYMDQSSNKYLTYDDMPLSEFKPIYLELLQTETLFVAQEGDEVVATYRLIPKTDRQAHTIYLGSFTIKSSLQKKGMGSQVLEYIIDESRRRQKIRIELTVDLNNDKAIGLYKKMGFVIEGTIRKSYKLSTTGQYYDEYLMALLL